MNSFPMVVNSRRICIKWVSWTYLIFFLRFPQNIHGFGSLLQDIELYPRVVSEYCSFLSPQLVDYSLLTSILRKVLITLGERQCREKMPSTLLWTFSATFLANTVCDNHLPFHTLYKESNNSSVLFCFVLIAFLFKCPILH